LRHINFTDFSRKTNKWTLPYQDHLGLGTVLTVSRPFFDKYITKNVHHHIMQVAGIAGADILYTDVEDALQVLKVS